MGIKSRAKKKRRHQGNKDDEVYNENLDEYEPSSNKSVEESESEDQDYQNCNEDDHEEEDEASDEEQREMVVKRDRNTQKSVLPSKMSSRSFFKMLIKLTSDQQNAVREIGFGHILSLQVMDCPRRLGRYLVDKFDYISHSLILEKGNMMILEADVYCTLGFPRGKQPVEEAPSHKNDDYSEFVRSFKIRWKEEILALKKKEDEIKRKRGRKTVGNKKLVDKEDELNWPITSSMCKILENRNDCGDDFKRDFIVCLISSIVKGQQNYLCNSKVLYSLLDVNAIKEFNWCDYTYQSLVSSVEDWKKNDSGNFKGPLLFLMLCYVDRVEFKARDVKRKFPTLCGWTDKILKRRCKCEEKEGFGKGYIVDPLHIGYEAVASNMLKNCDVLCEASTRQKEASDEVCGAFKMISVGISQEASDVVGGALKMISTGISELGKGLDQRGPSLFHSNMSKKAFLAVSDFFNTVSRIEIQPPTGEESDQFWDRPDIVEALIVMADNATTTNLTLKGRDGEHPQHSVQIPEEHPQHSVQIPEEHPQHSVQIPEDRRQMVFPSTEIPSFSLHLNLTPSPSKGCEDNDDSIFEEMSDRDDDRDLIIGERSKRPVKNLSRCMRSPYWTQFWDRLSDVTLKERIVSDYCFFGDDHEHPLSELLFKHNNVFTTREDMLTLRINEEVSTGVIDAFVLILNWINLQRVASEVHRVYFSTMAVYQLTFQSASEPLTFAVQTKNFERQLQNELKLYQNVSLIGVDFVFFPVFDHIRRHFYLICINFKHKVVELIDNQVLPARTRFVVKYQQTPKNVVLAFSNFLKKRKQKIHADLVGYPIKVAQMPWRSSSNVKDCGIFLMRHMETYRGQEKWNCGLKKNDSQALISLRAKYCSTIMLSELNEVRATVIKKAKDNLKKGDV